MFTYSYSVKMPQFGSYRFTFNRKFLYKPELPFISLFYSGHEFLESNFI